MLCQLSYASTCGSVGGKTPRQKLPKASQVRYAFLNIAQQTGAFGAPPRSRTPQFSMRLCGRKPHQNENDNPPSTQRAACAKYSVLPSFETKGR
jgi:hypothetical protein